MSDHAAVLSFLGAAGTVTGSRFLLNAGGRRILIDCGLFQGLKEYRLRNWEPFPCDPRSLDAVLITHAHLDHSGYLPALCRDGYRGKIYATGGTIDLCRILLPDSGRLQEEEANYANTSGYSKHSPARPLYTEDDAMRVQERFSEVEFDSPIEIGDEFRITFRRAGHVLGAASILIQSGRTGRSVLFSGDLGRPLHPLLERPEQRPGADTILIESTYGDRDHEEKTSLQVFEHSIVNTAQRGGVVVIPSFAVDRTEVVLFHLRHLMVQDRIPSLPIYVDSPMALASLRVYESAIKRGDPEIRVEVRGHPELLRPKGLCETRTTEESTRLNDLRGPMIIISASGMVTGGRVLHHLAHRLPDPHNTVILVGYQAAGTRGRSLLDGAPTIKMLGRYVPVRAEIVSVPAFSVHADRHELIAWLGGNTRSPDEIFIVHGEPAAAGSLQVAIREVLGWTAAVPHHLERVRLD